MTADPGAAPPDMPRYSAWQAVGLFVLLTACFSSVFWLLINLTRTVNAYYIFGLMWMPAVAALVTCRILHLPYSTFGWRWNNR